MRNPFLPRLAILPFDHRSFFYKNEIKDEKKIREYKRVIFDGIIRAIELGVLVSDAAMLVDEQYGADLYPDAQARGITNILTTERSGMEEFTFEYGEDFGAHIEALHPTYAKGLLKYRPDGDEVMNQRQLGQLRKLSDWCRGHNTPLLLEPLIGPTDDEKARYGQERFDRTIRPRLTVEMMRQFYAAGVEPDIWKIEGMETTEDYEMVSQTARANGRQHVGIVVLGRAEEIAHVERWLVAGKYVDGVCGFAVGRTIFWEAIKALHDEEVTREQAVEHIAKMYLHFYQVFFG